MAISETVSNVLVYVTLVLFLGIGLYGGYKQTKTKVDFLAALRTQSALPLAANFFTTSIGSSILFAYPEIATIAGLLGLFMYAFTSTVPLLTFAWFGPIIRRKCPEGFTLTQFILVRFHRINQIYMSLMSMAFMFCYMVAELSSIALVLYYLAGLDQLAPIIVISIVTTLYTAYGGFRASLFTDTIQGWIILILV
ncbi:772_t:CDS:2, partial [Paraglomus occultum]